MKNTCSLIWTYNTTSHAVYMVFTRIMSQRLCQCARTT